MAVNFYFEKQIRLNSRKQLKAFIRSVFEKECKTLNSLNYVFCDDEYLLEINKQYLKHDYYTDIITFDLSPDKAAAIIGEVYISVDRVKENAITHKSTLENELHRVIFHGALHLCGYKDKTAGQKKQMRSKEDFYLSKYNSK